VFEEQLPQSCFEPAISCIKFNEADSIANISTQFAKQLTDDSQPSLYIFQSLLKLHFHFYEGGKYLPIQIQTNEKDTQEREKHLSAA